MSKSKDVEAIRKRKKMRKKKKHAVCAVCNQNHAGDMVAYEGVFVCSDHPLPNVMAAMRK